MDIYERFGRCQEKYEEMAEAFSLAVQTLKAVKDGSISVDRITFTSSGFDIAPLKKEDKKNG